MKKVFKIGGILVAVAALIYGIKYIRDKTFSGNEEIKIIENYDKITTLADLIQYSEFEGKVLYVDLWGVYCKPCLEEFEYLPELKKEYRDKKVAFIYLAAPYGRFNDVQKWKSFVKKFDLKGHNALMSVAFYKHIWAEIPEMKNPFMIPHYLIIDKEGKIVNPNAPRPSNKQELYDEIGKLL